MKAQGQGRNQTHRKLRSLFPLQVNLCVNIDKYLKHFNKLAKDIW